MNLYTKSHDPDWDRTVHIIVDECDGISESVNNESVYKIVLLDKGTLSFESAGIKKVVSAPSVILLADEPVSFLTGEGVKTTTVFFSPTEVREEFTPERIKAREFDAYFGKTIYQDYMLVSFFQVGEDGAHKVVPLGMSAYDKIFKIMHSMKHELTGQNDGFWPCRSRSYIIELLSFISGYSVAHEKARVSDSINNQLVSEVIQYLNEHIGDKITLDDIVKKFSVNRNLLNELFVKETTMTCLNYFAKLRINLAQIMLAETELQISEIAGRVGYPDANYFIKVFKKQTGITPSSYRENN